MDLTLEFASKAQRAAAHIIVIMQGEHRSRLVSTGLGVYLVKHGQDSQTAVPFVSWCKCCRYAPPRHSLTSTTISLVISITSKGFESRLANLQFGPEPTAHSRHTEIVNDRVEMPDPQKRKRMDFEDVSDAAVYVPAAKKTVKASSGLSSGRRTTKGHSGAAQVSAIFQ